MDEMLVGKLWMAGVLAMMCTFGVVGLIGYLRAKHKGELDEFV
jgi:hypothetical protein